MVPILYAIISVVCGLRLITKCCDGTMINFINEMRHLDLNVFTLYSGTSTVPHCKYLMIF